MTKGEMWKAAGIIGGVIIVIILLMSRGVGGRAGGDVILPDIKVPEIKVPENAFKFPDFDWSELVLPNVPAYGTVAGYSPASCTCGCEDRQIAFDNTWLDAVSEGITNAYRDLFSSFNYVLPQTVQTLIATGGVRAYSDAGQF